MVRSGEVPGAGLEAAATPRLIRVTVKTPRQQEEFVVPEDRSIKEFKAGVSTRFSSPTDQLVLILAGRILKDHKTLSQHGIQDDATVYLVIQPQRRPQDYPGQDAGSLEGMAAGQVEYSSLSRPGSASSMSFGMAGLQELVSHLGLNTANFSEFQSQLTSNPEMMFQLLENPYIQSRLSNPNLMSELITDTPLKQQVIQNAPEMGHFLNTPDMLRLMLELARSPATVREIMKDPSQALSFLVGMLGGGRDPPDLTATEAPSQAAGNSFASLRGNPSLTGSQTPLNTRRRAPSPAAHTAPYTSHSNSTSGGSFGCSRLISDSPAWGSTRAAPDPGSGATISTTIKSLLQQTVKQLVQNILGGPRERGLWQDPDLGTTARPRSPPSTGKPPMQSLPASPEQIWQPEVLEAMPEALAEIQERLQALAMGEPGIPLQFLTPLVGSGHAADSAGRAPSSAGLKEASPPASAAPDQEITVQQMLEALAEANPQQAPDL